MVKCLKKTWGGHPWRFSWWQLLLLKRVNSGSVLIKFKCHKTTQSLKLRVVPVLLILLPSHTTGSYICPLRCIQVTQDREPSYSEHCLRFLNMFSSFSFDFLDQETKPPLSSLCFRVSSSFIKPTMYEVHNLNKRQIRPLGPVCGFLCSWWMGLAKTAPKK